MKIYCKTRKSRRCNEDGFVKGRTFCIVLDGATPLKTGGQFNEARWFVNYIKKNLSGYDGDIKSRLTSLCKDAYMNFPAEIREDDYLPSAGACWAEWNEENINIGILGDCEVTAITKDGIILRYFDDRLRSLDNLAINEMIAAAREHDTTVLQAKTFINDILIRHRKLINKPSGYSALALSRNVRIDEKAFTLKRDRIKTLYLYSDGFSQAFENLQIYKTHTEMFSQIDSIDDEIAKIVKASYDDPDCNKYPRFKTIDDITAVRIDF